LDDDPDLLAEQSPDDVFVAAVVFELALGLLALILGWTLGPDAREMIPEPVAESVWPVISGLFYGCLAAIPVLIVIEIVRRIPCEPVRALERLSDDGMFQTLLRLSPLELILISICAGVGEELLFRGWMLYWLAGFEPGGAAPSTFEFGAALVASSIAFGLVHPITKLYVFLAAMMGLYFGALLLWTGNLLIPIAAHAAYDAAQLIITGWRDESEHTQDA
jgi:membrane protease YdiL (CAAX protease family)